VTLNGHPEHRLPNTLNVSFRGQSGHELLARLPEVAASTGSACHAGSLHASPVLAAMGVPAEAAGGAVRFSLGRDTVPAEIEAVVERLVQASGPDVQ
jgi:cysteine desulfurase